MTHKRVSPAGEAWHTCTAHRARLPAQEGRKREGPGAMKPLLGAITAVLLLLAGCASDAGAPVQTSVRMNGRVTSGVYVGGSSGGNGSSVILR